MTEPSLDRREVLSALFPDPGEYLMLAGLAGSARDAAALTGEADYLFAFGGAMGGAVPMGLGMALAAPDRKVAVVTGDGELLMNAGALATVASTMPENLSIVCIDNGRHGETGGQLGHTARRTDLAKIAEGAGLPSGDDRHRHRRARRGGGVSRECPRTPLRLHPRRARPAGRLQAELGPRRVPPALPPGLSGYPGFATGLSGPGPAL